MPPGICAATGCGRNLAGGKPFCVTHNNILPGSTKAALTKMVNTRTPMATIVAAVADLNTQHIWVTQASFLAVVRGP